MTDAPLQSAASPLRVSEIYETFVALCVDTHGSFEAACAAAAVRGFEAVDQSGPSRTVARLLAEARFRRPGFFFTASKFLVEPTSGQSHTLVNLSLVARPGSFRDLTAALLRDLGAPTATNATPGVEFVFIGDPTTAQPLRSRTDAPQRFEKGEGDYVIINAWEVRERPDLPGDAVALSLQRSSF